MNEQMKTLLNDIRQAVEGVERNTEIGMFDSLAANERIKRHARKITMAGERIAQLAEFDTRRVAKTA